MQGRASSLPGLRGSQCTASDELGCGASPRDLPGWLMRARLKSHLKQMCDSKARRLALRRRARTGRTAGSQDQARPESGETRQVAGAVPGQRLVIGHRHGDLAVQCTSLTRISRFIRLLISSSPASQPWPDKPGGTATRAVMVNRGTPLIAAGVVSESMDSMLIPRCER